MIAPADAVRTYILAKDGNRPFLMRQAFAENAELEMVVKTDAISFPGTVKGLSELENTLVRRFGVESENVYTFCLSKPSEADRARFQCPWLVGMSSRTTGEIRVGCGRYDWQFDEQGKVSKLVIVIDVMKVLPAGELGMTMRWLSALPYPWCSSSQALQSIPAHEGLAEITAYLKQA
ncbi:MAG: hypothetical protein GY844_33620 [Bradyrhizobium sp.]|nr:hypothetical protein [Bradyrhizobium sp.]